MCFLINKTLQGFPKQYWYIAAGSSGEIVLPTTTDMMTSPSTNTVVKSEETVPTTTSSPSNSDNHDSTGIITVILFPIIGCLVILVFIVVAFLFCHSKNRQKGNTNSRPLNLEPVQERNRHPAAAPLQLSVSIGHMNDDPPNARHR